MCGIVVINTGNKMSLFAFSSKGQVDRLVTYSVKIYPRLYLAGLMDQHLQNPLCAHSMSVNLYIQHTYKEHPWFRDQGTFLHFIFSEFTVTQKYQ